jgi:hypothetical protein
MDAEFDAGDWSSLEDVSYPASVPTTLKQQTLEKLASNTVRLPGAIEIWSTPGHSLAHATGRG